MEELAYVIETCIDVEALFQNLKDAKPTDVKALSKEMAEDVAKCLDIPESVRGMDHRTYVDTKKHLIKMMEGDIDGIERDSVG